MEEFIKKYIEVYGRTVLGNPFKCHWVKVVRKDTNGRWGPKGKTLHVFRSGVCIGYMPNSWVEECLKDKSCKVYPRVNDIKGKKGEMFFADDVNSKEGEAFRKLYSVALVDKVEIQNKIVETQESLNRLRQQREEMEKIIKQLEEQEYPEV